MRITRSKLVFAIVSAICVGLPSSVFATNGYFAHGYGTKNKAMGGAGVALPQDSAAAATNPAGMAMVGDRFDFGMEFFAPQRGYTISGNSFAGMNTQQSSDLDFFVVPSMSINFMLSQNDSFGITVYGNGGMNTEYSKAVFGFFGGSAPTGVDLMQMFVPITYAHKFTPGTSIGISLVPVLQKFKAYGIQPFISISEDGANVSNNGVDTSSGFGYRIGGLVDVGGGVSLGASYQPMINMSKFNKYAGLFAEQGDFDVPSNYTVGAAWKITKGLSLLLDYERINYEDVKSVSNRSFVPPPFGASGEKLGNAEGPGFGWSSINVYKLGMQYETGTWALRAGWNHGDNPIKHEDVELMFNILAPGVITDHYTLGLTKKLNEFAEVNFEYMRSGKSTVTGFIPTGASTFGGGNVTIEMIQNSVELSLGMKF